MKRISAVLAATAAVVLCMSPTAQAKKRSHDADWKCSEPEAYSMPVKVLSIRSDGTRQVIWQDVIGRPSCAFFQGRRYAGDAGKFYQPGNGGDGGGGGGDGGGGGGGGDGGGGGGGGDGGGGCGSSK